MEIMTGEVLDIHNEYGSYQEYKESLDADFQETSERFVIIGYKLKAARDTDILKESGYRNVNEFAKAEYGLDKSQVSRFIRINDEFSENGYSKRLRQEYRKFGYTKLSIMLLLPGEIREELSADYSKAEIQAVKEEIDEEKKTTDLEVMLEEKDVRQQGRSIFGKVLYQMGKDDPELYAGLHDAVCSTVYDGSSRPAAEKLMDLLAPLGEAFISVRIPGEGRKMLSIKGADRDPVLVDVRSGEKQSCTWDQLISEAEAVCPDTGDGRKSFEILYGEPFPEEKAEVAPVQPKKEADFRKAGRVTKAGKPEKAKAEKEEQEAAGVGNEEGGENTPQNETCADGKPDQEHTDDIKPADNETGAAGSAGEDSAGGGEDGESGAGEPDAGVDAGPGEEGSTEADQTKRQINITDYPEYMPDNTCRQSEAAAGAAGVTEEPEMPGNTPTEDAGAAGGEKPVITDLDGMVQHTENQKRIMLEDLEMMRMQCIHNNWNGLIKKAEEIITRAGSIRNMEDMWNE